MTRILAILLLFLSCSLRAADYYVAQNTTGNGSGSDSGNCLSLSSVNSSWPASAGDTIHLVGTLTNSLTVGGGGSPGNLLTIHFEPGANFTLSAGVVSGDIIDLGNNNYITVDGGVNGFLQFTDNGTSLAYQSGASGISSFPTIGNITIENLCISNIYVFTAGTAANGRDEGAGVGLNGVITNLTIHNITTFFAQKGIFINYQPGISSGWNIYSNVALNCSWGAGVGDGSGGSILNGVNFHDNYANGQSAWNSPDNGYHENGVYFWAEHSPSYITNINIYNNFYGPDFGGNATTGIFLSSADGNGIWNANIFNNVLFTAVGRPQQWCDAFMGVSQHSGRQQHNDGQCRFKWNPISWGVARMRFTTTFALHSSSRCSFSMQTGPTSFVCDYDLYYDLNPWGGGFGGNGGSISSSAWQALGYDTH